jgi:hypothetical protein
MHKFFMILKNKANVLILYEFIIKFDQITIFQKIKVKYTTKYNIKIIYLN